MAGQRGRDNYFYKSGLFSGYIEYRYGASPRAASRVAAIFDRKRRKQYVANLMDVMRDWRLTPFEREGTIVASVRSTLCLMGYGWQQSNEEALILVNEVFRVTGAKRPSYAEGQREYSLSRETCATCLGELDDEDVAARRRFCSYECREVKRGQDAQRYDWLMKGTHSFASRIRRRDTTPARQCAAPSCVNEFRSLDTDARYCSIACFHAASITIKRRACAQCGNMFRPLNSVTAGRFCSVACTNESFRAVRVVTTCECCGFAFTARNALGRFCSNACKKLFGRVMNGQLPRKVTPTSVDWLFNQIQRRSAQPIYPLTPAIFDEWFKAAA